MQSKKAVSHIEMIISFTIFIGFILFLLIIFKPFGTAETGEVYLDLIERKIIEGTETTVDSVTIKLDDEADVARFECFCFEYSDIENNVIVKDSDGEKRPSKYSDGKICIEKLTEDYFYIYSNENFGKDEPSDCNPSAPLSRDTYALGLAKTEKVIFEDSLRGLDWANDLEDEINYQGIKDRFEVPSSVNFVFNVYYTDDLKDDIVFPMETPAGANILSRNIPIRIVTKSGVFDYAMLRIQVW